MPVSVTRIIGLASLALLGVLFGADASAAQTINLQDHEINLLGFGDLDYVQEQGDPGGFYIGQFVGHLSAGLSERFSLFSEVSATASDDGYNLEVERLFVRYDHSDLLKVSVGRFHTPLGFWNTAYHHGAWLQTSTKRPQIIKFGSEIIPIHYVGLITEGWVPVRDWNVKYQVGIGNGRYANIARAGDAGDINSNRAWLVSLSAKSLSLPIRVGASIYGDRVSPSFTTDVDETILSGYLVWMGDRIQGIAEFHHLHHESDTGPEHDTSEGFYVQASYRLPIVERVTPYARIEDTDIGPNDPLLSGLGLDYHASVLGVRYDVAPNVALKGEYRREEFADDGKQDNNYQLQIAFTVGGG